MLKEGATADADALQGHLAGRFAKWWLPDDYVFVDEIPRTSTGKFLKSALRERYEERLVGEGRLTFRGHARAFPTGRGRRPRPPRRGSPASTTPKRRAASSAV